MDFIAGQVFVLKRIYMRYRKYKFYVEDPLEKNIVNNRFNLVMFYDKYGTITRYSDYKKSFGYINFYHSAKLTHINHCYE